MKILYLPLSGAPSWGLLLSDGGQDLPEPLHFHLIRQLHHHGPAIVAVPRPRSQGSWGLTETFPPVLARRSRAPGATSRRRRTTSAFMAKSTSTAWEFMAMLQLTTVTIASSAAGNVATPSGPAHHKHPINPPYQTFMMGYFSGAGGRFRALGRHAKLAANALSAKINLLANLPASQLVIRNTGKLPK